MKRPDHGGVDERELRELGLDPEGVLDLSANVAPVPPPRRVMEALRRCSPFAYPDPSYRRLREALGRMVRVGDDYVLPGNGATELIHLICRAFLSPERRVVVLGPTFGEYEWAARLAGACATILRAREEEGFVWSISEVVEHVRAARPRLLFLCNPNNPTGAYLARDDVGALLEALGDGLLVLDEAYLDFVESPWDSLRWVDGGRLIVLRSVTKVFRLPGVRLGYAVGRPDVLDAVAAVQFAWSVNAYAEEAGVAAAESLDHVERVRQAVREAKRRLAAELSALGLRTVVGAANFLMVRVGDARMARLRLLRQGVSVRDCASFGLPAYVRVAVPAVDEVDRVARAFSRAVVSPLTTTEGWRCASCRCCPGRPRSCTRWG